MGAVGGGRQVAALDLVLALGAGLDPLETVADGVVDGLVVAGLEVQELEAGDFVFGTVVLIEPFGVFVDLGVRFPALLETIYFRSAAERPMRFPADYPSMGERVGGAVISFSEPTRQIRLSQRAMER